MSINSKEWLKNKRPIIAKCLRMKRSGMPVVQIASDLGISSQFVYKLSGLINEKFTSLIGRIS